MSNQHVTFTAAGVRVTFPFQPYDIQREYVESVISAAKNKQNALLESPTGTGKTLSLLCSTLAWQQIQTTPNKMIYYTSRTHVQLNQAAKEMKRTAYARVPAVVIASRGRMCLNDEVLQQSLDQDHTINRACHNAIAKNSCSFHTNYEEKMKRIEFDNVHDIEDLFTYGRANQCCPYYTSKKIAESKASLVFMPYNYLLDLSLRKSTQLRLDNSIVIFDEGHNIESALKDSASAHFTQKYLEVIQDSCEKLPAKLDAAINKELHGLTRYGYDPDKKKKASSAIFDEFAKPKEKNGKEKELKPNPIEELAEKLTNERLQQVSRCARSLLECKDLLKTKEGQYMDTNCALDNLFSVMSRAGVGFGTSDMLIDTLDSMGSFWSIAGVMNPQTVANYLTAITNLCHFIEILFPSGCRNRENLDRHMAKLKDCYICHIKCELGTGPTTKLINWEMNLWCLNPAVGIKRVLDNSCVVGPRSIIITSGTLAPLRPFETELDMSFPIRKEFNHLIRKEQFKVMMIGASPTGHDLTSTYMATKDHRYSKALGETLLPLFKILPFGSLVFFPSYSLMKKVTQIWESQPMLWKNMCKATRIFKECKDQKLFEKDMDSFTRIIDRNGRAVYLGVCRGKLSEGTNLQGNHCRTVIVIGLPFPSSKDARVIETKAYHNKRQDPGGNHWYTTQMRRALGQAFGRVIRSKDDFGMLILCDPRFALYSYGLSSWIKEFYPKEMLRDFKALPGEIKDFFAQHDVDVDSISISQSINGTQNSVFEFDETTKIVNKASNQANALNGRVNYGLSGSSIINMLPRLNCPSTSLSNGNKNITGRDERKTPGERRAEILASMMSQPNQSMPRKFKSTRVPGSIEEIDLTKSKRPKTATEVFETVCTDLTDEMQSNLPKPNAMINSQKSIIINNNNNNTVITCYICKNRAERPYIINCSCARIGCLTCLRVLDKKPCGDCDTILKSKKFKPKLFSCNPFQKR